MPRQPGRANYNKDVLLSIISEVEPVGNELWQRVSTLYTETVGEAIAR